MLQFRLLWNFISRECTRKVTATSLHAGIRAQRSIILLIPHCLKYVSVLPNCFRAKCGYVGSRTNQVKKIRGTKEYSS